jgi:hypothetical protein
MLDRTSCPSPPRLRPNPARSACAAVGAAAWVEVKDCSKKTEGHPRDHTPASTPRRSSVLRKAPAALKSNKRPGRILPHRHRRAGGKTIGATTRRQRARGDRRESTTACRLVEPEQVMRRRISCAASRSGPPSAIPTRWWSSLGRDRQRRGDRAQTWPTRGRTPHRRQRAHRRRGDLTRHPRWGRARRSSPTAWRPSRSLGADARIGPFAHLRPGTELEPDVRTSELRRDQEDEAGQRQARPTTSATWATRSYGQRVNVGAGTITCNLQTATRSARPSSRTEPHRLGHPAGGAGAGGPARGGGGGGTITKDGSRGRAGHHPLWSRKPSRATPTRWPSATPRRA